MNDNVIRQSQLITTWGPGAMIDLPKYSVIVSGLQDWATLRREKVNEPRLVAKLQRILDTPILELFTPPRHEENAQRAAPVGARIFPTWFIVKDARLSPRNAQWRRRRLVRWDQLHKRRFDEDGKRKPVVPVRFVSACPKGHIDDLNWRAFVHPGGRRCEQPLWLEERGTSGDIVDTYAVCECGEERSLYEAAGARTSALGRCAGKRPWIGQFAREACEESYRLLVRTASNAYFPQTMSVISLPESDAGLAARVSQHRDRLKAADDLGALASFRMIPELAAAFADADDAAVIAEYRRQRDGGGGADVPVKDAEFEILDKGDARIGEDDPRSEFFAETLDRAEWDRDGDPPPIWNKTVPRPSTALAGGRPRQRSPLEALDKLVLVHRLREGGGPAGVHALRGDRPGQGRRDRPRRGTGGACRDHDLAAGDGESRRGGVRLLRRGQGGAMVRAGRGPGARAPAGERVAGMGQRTPPRAGGLPRPALRDAALAGAHADDVDRAGMRLSRQLVARAGVRRRGAATAS